MRTDIQSIKNSSAYAEEAFIVDLQSMIHTIMEEKGISRADLAKNLGVSRARVTQMFSSECSNLTVRLLARTFFALGETLEISTQMIRDMRAGESVDVAPQSFERLQYWQRFLDALNDNYASDVQVAADETSKPLIVRALDLQSSKEGAVAGRRVDFSNMRQDRTGHLIGSTFRKTLNRHRAA